MMFAYDDAKRDEVQEAIEKSVLGDLHVSSEIYLGADVDALLSVRALSTDLWYDTLADTTPAVLSSMSVNLSDRSLTFVEPADSTSGIVLYFPPSPMEGKARDFLLVLSCNQNLPDITVGSIATLFTDDAGVFSPQTGVNVISFTEFSHNKYMVARRFLGLSTEILPTNVVELARAAGVPTANTLEEVRLALDLGTSATVEDALHAAMSK